jgi:hypothetical protein
MVRRRTLRGAWGMQQMVHHRPSSTTRQDPMSNAKNGNKAAKETKKPKKTFVPNAPGLPAGLSPLAYNPLKPKKR